MPVSIVDGWMDGSLLDDTGKAWPISQSRQSPTGAQHGSPVNLVLHTTETDSLVPKLEFPSNFQCGEGKIVQHIQLGMSGDAVFTYDRDCVGIEMVGRSQLARWLPHEQTLGPTVALVAWLDETDRINTGLRRPFPFPVVLDQLPAAVVDYYRRHDPTQRVGVYGHVDLSGGNSHWDPGSFDYPAFFTRVSTAIEGGDVKDPRVDAIMAAVTDYNQGNDPDPNGGLNYDKMMKALKDAASKPRPDATTGITKSVADSLYAPIVHEHSVAGKAK